MGITKAFIDDIPSQSLAATATKNGGALDLRTAYGGTYVFKASNGATGPSTPPQFFVEVSDDGVSWIETKRITLSDANNAVTPIEFAIAREVLYARMSVTNGGGQSITIEGGLHYISAIV